MWKRVLDTVILLLFLSWAIPCHAQEVIKLHASVVAKTFGFGPVWVASKQGFFNQQKLDVEVLIDPRLGRFHSGSGRGLAASFRRIGRRADRRL